MKKFYLPLTIFIGLSLSLSAQYPAINYGSDFLPAPALLLPNFESWVPKNQLQKAGVTELQKNETNKYGNSQYIWQWDKKRRIQRIERQYEQRGQPVFSTSTFSYDKAKWVRAVHHTERDGLLSVRVDSLIWKDGKIAQYFRRENELQQQNFAYNAQDSVTCIRLLINGALFSEQWFSYSPKGKMLLDSTVGSTIGTRTVKYAYDSKGRLLSRAVQYINPDPTLSFDEGQQYTYNKAGQIVQERWLHNDRPPIVMDYKYDNKGRRILRITQREANPELRVRAEHEILQEQYNKKGRLSLSTEMDKVRGTIKSTVYETSPDGRLVIRTDYENGSGEPTVTTVTHYNGDQLPGEISAEDAKGNKSTIEFIYRKSN